MFATEETSYFNERVQEWTDNLMTEIKDELDTLGVQHYPYSPNKTPLRKALKAQLYFRNGSVYQIGIKMPRSAIFLHKGLSRWHPKERPGRAKEWFNPVVERNLRDLKDIVQVHQKDFYERHIFIK